MPLIFALALLLGKAEQNILIIGDSLTAGYGLKEDEAYPSILESKLTSEGLHWNVINSGVSGDTTAGGLRRIDWILTKAKPDFVVIALGGNDLLRGLPLEMSKANLSAMIKKAKDLEIPVVLVGIQAPANVGKEYEKQFNEMFEKVAQRESVPLLPNLIEGIAGKSELNQIDGIHPNTEGQKLIAERMLQFLKPHLKVKEGS